MDNNRIVLSANVKKEASEVNYCLYDMLTKLFNNISLSCHEQKFSMSLCMFLFLLLLSTICG